MKAVAYMRCSGFGQVDGDTWDRQLSAIQKYARANEIEIVDQYRDEGVSGKTELEGRAGLAACLERVENNGVKLVLVESADRLARDAMVGEIIIRQFQKAGCTVISASGGVNLTEGDDSNPTSKLIRQILASVAEFDRCVTVLKLKAAKERIRAKGERCEGRKPFGSHPDRPEEKETLALMISLSATQNAQQIAEELNGRGITSRSGGKFFPNTVRRILARTA